MAKPTPGPWVTADKYYLKGQVVTSDGSAIVCSCIRTRGRGRDMEWDEVYANAKLISAAPEMLAALHCVAGYESDGSRECRCDELEAGQKCDQCVIWAAIDKAEGKY